MEVIADAIDSVAILKHKVFIHMTSCFQDRLTNANCITE